MRTFLGALMVLIVSGDGETIKGILEDSVFLPCICSERDPDSMFHWQMETKPNPTLMLKYHKTLNVSGSYKGRAKIFLDENSNNCSVLLTNITAGDQGEYKCIFHSHKRYQRFLVNLNISASYTVCQKASDKPNDKSVNCHVTGRYRETEIQWNLHGQLLTDSSTTTITNSPYTLDASTGLYHFYSTLSTKLNVTSEFKCDVKAKGLSTNISQDCKPETGFAHGDQGYVMRYAKIIPILLVLGFSLVLWCRWKFSQH